MKKTTLYRKPQMANMLQVSFDELMKLREKYPFISISDYDMEHKEDGYINSSDEKVLDKILKNQEFEQTPDVWFVNKTYAEENFLNSLDNVKDFVKELEELEAQKIRFESFEIPSPSEEGVVYKAIYELDHPQKPFALFKLTKTESGEIIQEELDKNAPIEFIKPSDKSYEEASKEVLEILKAIALDLKDLQGSKEISRQFHENGILFVSNSGQGFKAINIIANSITKMDEERIKFILKQNGLEYPKKGLGSYNFIASKGGLHFGGSYDNTLFLVNTFNKRIDGYANIKHSLGAFTDGILEWARVTYDDSVMVEKKESNIVQPLLDTDETLTKTNLQAKTEEISHSISENEELDFNIPPEPKEIGDKAFTFPEEEDKANEKQIVENTEEFTLILDAEREQVEKLDTNRSKESTKEEKISMVKEVMDRNIPSLKRRKRVESGSSKNFILLKSHFFHFLTKRLISTEEDVQDVQNRAIKDYRQFVKMFIAQIRAYQDSFNPNIEHLEDTREIIADLGFFIKNQNAFLSEIKKEDNEEIISSLNREFSQTLSRGFEPDVIKHIPDDKIADYVLVNLMCVPDKHLLDLFETYRLTVTSEELITKYDLANKVLANAEGSLLSYLTTNNRDTSIENLSEVHSELPFDATDTENLIMETIRFDRFHREIAYFFALLETHKEEENSTRQQLLRYFEEDEFYLAFVDEEFLKENKTIVDYILESDTEEAMVIREAIYNENLIEAIQNNNIENKEEKISMVKEIIDRNINGNGKPMGINDILDYKPQLVEYKVDDDVELEVKEDYDLLKREEEMMEELKQEVQPPLAP